MFNNIYLKSFIAFGLVFIFSLTSISPALAETINKKNTIIIDGQEFTEDEFNDLLDSSYSVDVTSIEKQTRSGVLTLYTGTMFVPVIGKVVILTSGVVLVGGVAYKAGSWVSNKVSNYLKQKQANEIKKINDTIPSKIKNGYGKVNLNKFVNKNNKPPNGNNGQTFSYGTAWKISKDKSNHGGSAWKLLKNNKRIASLDKNGKILRK